MIVGVAEMSRWVIRAQAVHAEVSEQIQVGTSKRNTEHLAKVVEGLAMLQDAIARVERFILVEEVRAELSLLGRSWPSGVGASNGFV